MSWYGHYPPPPADYGAPGYGAPGAGAGAAPSGYPAPPPGPPSHAYPGAPAYGAPPPGAYYQQPPQPPQQPQQPPHAYAPPYGYAHQYPGPAAYHRGAAPYAQPPLPAVAQQQAHYSMSPPPTGASPAPPPPLKEGELRPPPDVAHDPNSFRRYFKQQLDLLTYNSKPVITSLTLFAHEHAVRMAAVVSQCFDEHLRTCPPAYVLPAFYLLDSICKNIGPPYLALFSRFIERAFLSAYHSVDPPTRTKLEELLGTWKTGGADGGELFRDPEEPRGPAGGGAAVGRVQRGIEGALFGARGRGDGLLGRAAKDAEMYNAGVQQLPHTATTTERSGVLYDVRRLLTLRQDVLTTNPADQINASQIVALKKLEQLILNTQLTTEQVTQIRNQLAALAPPATAAAAGTPPPGTRASASASPVPPRPVAPPAPPPLAPPGAAVTNALSPLMQQQQPHGAGSPGPASQYYGSPPMMAPGLAPPTAPAAMRSRIATPTLKPAPAPAMSPAPPGAAQAGGLVNGIDLGLLSQLSASGALANLFGSGQGQATPPPPGVKVEAGGGDVKPLVDAKSGALLVEKDELAGVWEEEAVRFGVTLNGPDLATPRPHALALLYLQFLPLQCRQCGLRQPDSRTGKRKMDEHLDWHFVHKRRIREAAGRASGRSWFTSEEEWYTSDATHHPQSNVDQPSSSLLSAGAAAAAASSGAGGQATLDRAALQKQKVAVPAGGSAEAELALGDKPCPICQDRFKSEWSDDEEEWVWWNAVVVDKVLYHATCHAEAALSRSNAAASASRTSVRTSRESTPATAASRKRKAGSVDPSAAAAAAAPNQVTSPTKVKLEGGDAAVGGEGGGGADSAAGVEEPEAKRVKPEPLDEGAALFSNGDAATQAGGEEPPPAPNDPQDPPSGASIPDPAA